jgi:hypothetical protein
MALVASSLLPACSDDRSVGTGGDDTFKERSCFDFTDYLHTLSVVPTSGWAVAVDVEDGMAYLAEAPQGFKVVDLADPGSPAFRGSLGALQPGQDVVVKDGFAYVTLGADGVAVVDVGDPDRPVVVGRAGTPGNALGVTVVDTIAYVADDVVGLMLLGVGSPDTPQKLGVDNSPGRAVDVAVSGALAYVADEVNGLRVVNVNNPEDPWLLNTVALPAGGEGVAVAGYHAFVAAGAEGLQVVDISVPGEESVVGSVETRAGALGVELDAGGGTAFVACGQGGTEIFDVTQPNAPTGINAVATSGEALDVSVDGGLLVVAEGAAGLRTGRSVTARPPPKTAQGLDTGEGPVATVAARPGMVLGTGAVVGLFTIDPWIGELQPSGSVSLAYEAVDLAVRGDTAYVAADGGGIEMIDVTDAAAPASAGWVPFQGDVASLDVSGDVLYFVSGQQFGTWIPGDADVTTIQLQLATTTTVTVAGDYAYAGERANEIYSVYVSDPKQPLLISTSRVDGTVECIVAHDKNLFLLTSGNNKPNTADGLGIYDLRFPNMPLSIGFVDLASRPLRAALSGDFLYVVLGFAGLQVFDVSDPVNPLRVGSVPSEDESTGVVVLNGAVFVADGAGGLFTLPVQGCVP